MCATALICAENPFIVVVHHLWLLQFSTPSFDLYHVGLATQQSLIPCLCGNYQLQEKEATLMRAEICSVLWVQ